MIPIYYINLERSLKRRKYMEKTFPNAERVEAYDGIKIHTYKNIQYQKNTKQSNNELACSLSHIKAIVQAYKDGHDKAIILEDDIENIIPLDIIEKNIINCPKDAECIQLYSNNTQEVRRMTLLKNNYEKWNPKKWSTGAYCIFRKGMEKIIEKFYKNNIININIKLDNYVADNCILYGNMITYSYTKPLFINKLFDSDIEYKNSKIRNNLIKNKLLEVNIHNFIKKYMSEKNV